jgi:hypothetical protein
MPSNEPIKTKQNLIKICLNNDRFYFIIIIIDIPCRALMITSSCVFVFSCACPLSPCAPQSPNQIPRFDPQAQSRLWRPHHCLPPHTHIFPFSMIYLFYLFRWRKLPISPWYIGCKINYLLMLIRLFYVIKLFLS